MKLTVRQQVILIKFLEYFAKSQAPVHYEALAKELGLSKSTTYDMLKLLESKDLLRAVYVIPPDPEIHGRSKAMFVPAEKSIDLVFRPLGGEGVKREQLRNFLIRAMEKATSTYDGFWKDWPDDMQDLLAIAA